MLLLHQGTEVTGGDDHAGKTQFQHALYSVEAFLKGHAEALPLLLKLLVDEGSAIRIVFISLAPSARSQLDGQNPFVLLCVTFRETVQNGISGSLLYLSQASTFRQIAGEQREESDAGKGLFQRC